NSLRSLFSLCHIVLFFFFQAEDGIRDFHVTGVQTCALPISIHSAPQWRPCGRREWRATRQRERPPPVLGPYPVAPAHSPRRCLIPLAGPLPQPPLRNTRAAPHRPGKPVTISVGPRRGLSAPDHKDRPWSSSCPGRRNSSVV